MPPDPRWDDALRAGRAAAAGLLLAAPERSLGVHGETIGAGVGQSIEFMDFREYEPGDDLRRIDWAAYARSDRLMIRRHREEISPRLDVLIDASRSMDLPGAPKADAALALAAATIDAARRAGYHARPWRCDAHAATRLERLEAWAGFDGGAGAAPAFHHAARHCPAGGVRLLISDLLFPADLPALVRALADGARWLIILQVLSEHDVAAPPPGSLRLRDRETGAVVEVELDAERARAFAARVEAHRAACRDAARRARAAHVELIAEHQWGGGATDLALAPLLAARVLTAA